jgi:hypothetical protein
MTKAKKGLADTGDGEFILNERGTSVFTDHVEEDPKPSPDNVNDTVASQNQTDE